ncbi:MAG: hypothetical protein OXC31_06535 [Spirochaetaceae bacterium]|nr:hypothetical protein [Spirochaetaceae bacterium]
MLRTKLAALLLGIMALLGACNEATPEKQPQTAGDDLQCSACGPGPERTWLITAFEHADYVIHTDEVIRDYTMDELELLADSDVLLTLDGGKATARCVPKCYHPQLNRELEVIIEADYSVSLRGGIRVVLGSGYIDNESYELDEPYKLWGEYEVSDGRIYIKLNSLYGNTASSVTQLWGTSEFSAR